VVVPLSKDIVDDIPDGTIYKQIASGGGGYGDPQERDKNKVIEDVKNEICSPEKAKKDYGIDIKEILDNK